MFANFLLTILLLTSIVMIVLLIMPNKDTSKAGPLMGAAMFVLLAALALFGAFSVVS